MANFLDLTTGLPALWAKIKSKFYTKAEVDALIPEDEVMWVHITGSDAPFSVDKTFDEIYNHVHNGGVVYADWDGYLYAQLGYDIDNLIEFGGCDVTNDGITGDYFYIEKDSSGNTTISRMYVPVNASTTNPLMDGTVNKGTSMDYARADHVHPSDTSKADKWYGYCTTGEQTQNKEVNINGFTSTNLVAGTKVTIKFRYSNQADQPTLNISGTGAKPILTTGIAINNSQEVNRQTAMAYEWNSGIFTFVYDGYANWIMESQQHATTSYFGVTKLSNTISNDTTTALTPSAVYNAGYALSSNVLTKTNTTSYTPTANYHPATKKYVDDTIPTKTSDLTNDSLFLSGSAQSSSYANGYILIGTKNNSSAILADTLQVSSTTTGNNPSQTLTVGRSHSSDGFKGEIQLSNRPSIGGYTTITPTANSAITLSLPSASGTLALTTDISTTLSGLTDTNISNPANGQALIYNSATSKWVNDDVGGVFETTLSYNESTDVISSNRTYAEIVAAYNSGKTCIATEDGIIYGLSQVVAVDNDQNLAPFVMFTGLSEGAGHTVIKIYNDGRIGGSQAGNFLENLDNVQPGILQNGQVLQYDATNEVWVNATLPTGITETRVNELIAAALAQYGDGDTATYGYNDASEVNY